MAVQVDATTAIPFAFVASKGAQCAPPGTAGSGNKRCYRCGASSIPDIANVDKVNT